MSNQQAVLDEDEERMDPDVKNETYLDFCVIDLQTVIDFVHDNQPGEAISYAVQHLSCESLLPIFRICYYLIITDQCDDWEDGTFWLFQAERLIHEGMQDDHVKKTPDLRTKMESFKKACEVLGAQRIEDLKDDAYPQDLSLPFPLKPPRWGDIEWVSFNDWYGDERCEIIILKDGEAMPNYPPDKANMHAPKTSFGLPLPEESVSKEATASDELEDSRIDDAIIMSSKFELTTLH